MKKLKTLKASAKPRILIPLRPVLKYGTRLSSMFSVISRYIEQKQPIYQLNIPEIMDILPMVEQEDKILELYEILKQLDPVTKTLQSETFTMVMVRSLFEQLIKLITSTESRLSSSARVVSIISNTHFENGVTKILKGRSYKLTDGERKATNAFIVGRNNELYSQPRDSDLSVQRAFKRLKTILSKIILHTKTCPTHFLR